MKRTIEKPSASSPMCYFTPELYLAGNSADDDVVDAAERAWREASDRYQEYLRSVTHLMPGSVRELAEAYLHDAEVVATRSHVVMFPSTQGVGGGLVAPLPTYSVLVLEERQPISLTYFLWDVVRSHPSPVTWPFPAKKAFWLYEELEAHQGPGELWFRHKILLSNGIVLEIPFADAFLMRSLPVNEAAAG